MRDDVDTIAPISAAAPAPGSKYDRLIARAKETKPVIYREGHEIIKQGDVGETFYLLLDGQVDILVKNEQGNETLVNQLSKGSYFGEMALMGNKRRNATVRVSKG